ncbi:hypothetical protein ACX3V1_29300 [Escherichia coli]
MSRGLGDVYKRQRYAWYCQQMMQARELELEH